MTDWLLPFPSLRGDQLMRVFIATAQTDQILMAFLLHEIKSLKIRF